MVVANEAVEIMGPAGLKVPQPSVPANRQDSSCLNVGGVGSKAGEHCLLEGYRIAGEG
jgi:hypothetical protein